MDSEAQKKLAAALFNRTWDLLDKPDRTPAEDFRMIHAAHASLYHWLEAGTPLHEARGEWQVSRVYAVLGWAQPAAAHGKRSLQICLDHGIGDFDLAFGHEAVARAALLAGDREGAALHLEAARKAAEGIAKPGDRDYLLKELDSIGL